MGLPEFEEYLKKVAEEFSAIPSSEKIKVVSNLDADGISAAAIVIKALQRENRKYSVSIIHQLREKELVEYASENYNYFIFADLGSGALDLIDSILRNKKALVLDHHHPKGSAKNVWHVNPHLFDINGSAEVSAAGVVFMFCKTLNKENEDMAHIALIGAIGDVQENDGFIGLNNKILDIAVEKNLIQVVRDLKLFGMQSRPIHKLLEYSSDINIPDVTGTESGTIQFLQNLGINPKNGNGWKFIEELTEEEKKKLVAGIIMKRVNKEIPEDIFSNRYILKNEQGMFRDAKEFSTLLNACGRLDKSSIGIGACLGEDDFKKKALAVHLEYKKEIVSAMRWYNENKNSENIINNKKYLIINAKNNVKDTMIGTIISILSKSNEFSDGTFMLSMARKPDNVTKVSIRVSGSPKNIHLKEMVAEMATKVGGEAGGHQYAAGAIISSDKEDAFVKAAVEIFNKANL